MSAGEDTLPPILLPFTIEVGGQAIPEALTERSLGHALGLWWEEADDPAGGIVVTGIKPGSPVAGDQAIAVGDVIVQVDDNPARTLADMGRILASGIRDQFRFTVRRGSGAEMHSIVVRRPPTLPRAATDSLTSPRAARVPTATRDVSIRKYIECILCNPLQGEVTHSGVSADPEFGCLGADLEFGIHSVGLSEMRNAIVQSEHRLKDVDVSQHDVEVRQAGETLIQAGIRVEASLAEGEDAVVIDLEIQELTSKRKSNRLRRRIRHQESGR